MFEESSRGGLPLLLVASAALWATGEAFVVPPLSQIAVRASDSVAAIRIGRQRGCGIRRMMCMMSSSGKDPLGGEGDWEEYGGGDDGDDGALQLPSTGAELPPPFTAEDMTNDLRERIVRVSIDAMDNWPPQEVDKKIGYLWAAGPEAGPDGRSLRGLAELAGMVEEIEEEAIKRVKRPGADLYDLEDAIRAARARIRTYVGDSDYYDPDHWLSKGDVSSKGGMGWFDFFK